MIRSIIRSALPLAAMLTLGLGAPLAAQGAASPAGAQTDAATTERAYQAEMKALADKLTPRTGTIAISDAKVRLNLGEAYYFLPADQARMVLTQAWGNPPDSVEGVLGMVFPAGASFMDDSWGAVLTFERDGYVSDKDAADIDYDAMMQEIKDGEADTNAARTDAGFPAHHMRGWAQRPTYDKVHNTLIWAKQFRVDGADVDTLNYDVRLLGRYGVLSMNMISSMPHLAEVRDAARAFGQSARFDRGSRYADFVPGADKVAEYGLGGLVAAGAGVVVAKKLGLLGGLLLLLKKLLIPVIAVFGGAFAWLRRRFFGSGAEVEE